MDFDVLSPGRPSLGKSSSSSNGPRRSAPFSDRFIPARSSTNFDAAFHPGASPSAATKGGLFSMLLRNELLGEDGVLPEPSAAGAAEILDPAADSVSDAAAAGARRPPGTPSVPATPSVLRFRPSLDAGSTVGAGGAGDQSPLSPLRSSSRLLQSPGGSTPRRKIPKVPFKVLDAPGLADDFYLNVVDWSANNVVAVGLGAAVYLWSAHTSRASKLTDLGSTDDVACVAFTEVGTSVAVGTRLGNIVLFDAEKQTMIRTIPNSHTGRIGCAAWNGPILATGSRDKGISERDTRLPTSSCIIRELEAHRQEVCGLKYSFEGLAGPHRQLASGGNDNKLHVWDARRNGLNPIYTFGDHCAAVKALAWSPHQSGVLASGGGTADRSIRLWSTLTGSSLSVMDTGSQVCGLVFSRTLPELVSTHGYSLNQICVWRMQTPSTPLQKLVTLQGHSLRVLYLALSPDGSTILTGAGDESLRFWSVWPGRTSHSDGLRLGGLIIPGAPGALLR